MLSELLTESGEPQTSTTDPDSRSLLIQGQVEKFATTRRRQLMININLL
ncbi:MAG: hypothetical protein IPN13_19745 [Bacteroidetes bacterium]|nr:hypothetical protein [Bacteroidota bacterium]